MKTNTDQERAKNNLNQKSKRQHSSNFHRQHSSWMSTLNHMMKPATSAEAAPRAARLGQCRPASPPRRCVPCRTRTWIWGKISATNFFLPSVLFSVCTLSGFLSYARYFCFFSRGAGPVRAHWQGRRLLPGARPPNAPTRHRSRGLYAITWWPSMCSQHSTAPLLLNDNVFY